MTEENKEFLKKLLSTLTINPTADDAEHAVKMIKEIIKSLE